MTRNIFLVGMPGSGKTTLGKPLAAKLGMNFIDLDDEIEKSEGCTISQIFADRGEDYFRKTERQALVSVIANSNHYIMATGGGAACFFDNLDLMRAAGLTIFLDISSAELLNRLRPHIAHRPLLQGKSEAELLQEIKQKLGFRRKHYGKADIVVKNDNISTEELWEMIRRRSPQ